MLNKKLTIIFFIIILIEGFFTLSLELLVMRQTIPFVGNGTEMVSIIISSVLLPLAIGYYYGGKRYSILIKKSNKTKIRKILTNNIYTITILTGIGFSYITMHTFFTKIPIENVMISLSIYLIIFLVIPTYLLGQTVPLISNYFSSKEMSKITGKILFLSTAGSFIGSVMTVLVLMRYIGVSNTLIAIESLLLLLILLISKNKLVDGVKVVLLILAIFLMKNMGYSAFNIDYDNQYNTVSIIHDKNENKYLKVNNSLASMISKDKKRFFPYVDKINDILKAEKGKNKKILVIGAGGFTVGYNDETNNYTYIDIDNDLKKTTEEKFLKTKLKNNKKFIHGEVRKFLIENKIKYDIIIIDAYTNRRSIPASLVTREFYTQVKLTLNKDGYAISNIISDMFLNDKFSRNVDVTMRSVFNTVVSLNTREENLKMINVNKKRLINNLYILKNKEDVKIYTDDKNTCSFDKPLEI